MAQFAAALLGPVQFMRDGAALGGFESDKVRALLIFLLVEADRPHRRGALAELLWPERPERAALLNLNQALANLRRTLGDREAATPLILATRDAIQINPAADYTLDTAAFGALLDECERHPHRDPASCAQCARRRAEAVTLYRGAFLEGFTPRDCLEFQEWALVLRERLQRAVLPALEQLAAFHERRGAYALALPAVFRQLELDPWNEEAHRAAMRLLERDGQHSAALAQFERCRVVLERELGVEPDSETLALHEQIRAGTLHEPAALPAPATLPQAATPFLGRADELARLTDYLSNRDCRLVTIVGLGGSGKTRLALQAADEQREAFDEVVVVPLAVAQAASQIVPTIAQALGLALSGADDPLAQVAAHLHGKQALLVLDNLEHLAGAGAVVAALLERAAGLTVLATSRERLQARGEWVFSIGGLELPNVDAPGVLEASAAGALFMQSARRVAAEFAPSPADRQAIARLCRQLAGHPLGIELAAAWVPLLSCAEIEAEIAANLDLPASAEHDRPARHRSLRALLATTWQLLPDAEQQVLRRLAVFRGGFDRAAAGVVAGAGLPQLAALAGKSLLARGAAGRYDMHPLVLQYAAARLAESGEEAAVQRAFVAHMAGLVAQAEPHLKGAEEQLWFDRLAAEHDNLRAALDRALALGDVAAAAGMGAVLRWFWYIRGYIAEGREWLERILRAADAAAPPIAPVVRARLLQGVGVLASDQADYPAATAYFAASIELNQQLGDSVGVQAAMHSLGLLHAEQGNYAAAQAQFEASLAVCRELDHQWGIANRLNSLGTLAHNTGEHARALEYLEEALAVARPIGNDQLTAMIVGNLADVAREQGDHARAGALYASALEQYRALGDPRSAALALQGLGSIALQAGRMDEAARQLHEGLAISWASANRRDLATYMGYIAELWLARGQAEAAVRLCAALLSYRAQANMPMALLDQRQHDATLAAAREVLTPPAFDTAWAAGSVTPLERLIEQALQG